MSGAQGGDGGTLYSQFEVVWHALPRDKRGDESVRTAHSSTHFNSESVSQTQTCTLHSPVAGSVLAHALYMCGHRLLANLTAVQQSTPVWWRSTFLVPPETDIATLIARPSIPGAAALEIRLRTGRGGVTPGTGRPFALSKASRLERELFAFPDALHRRVETAVAAAALVGTVDLVMEVSLSPAPEGVAPAEATPSPATAIPHAAVPAWPNQLAWWEHGWDTWKGATPITAPAACPTVFVPDRAIPHTIKGYAAPQLATSMLVDTFTHTKTIGHRFNDIVSVFKELGSALHDAGRQTATPASRLVGASRAAHAARMCLSLVLPLGHHEGIQKYVSNYLRSLAETGDSLKECLESWRESEPDADSDGSAERFVRLLDKSIACINEHSKRWNFSTVTARSAAAGPGTPRTPSSHASSLGSPRAVLGTPSSGARGGGMAMSWRDAAAGAAAPSPQQQHTRRGARTRSRSSSIDSWRDSQPAQVSNEGGSTSTSRSGHQHRSPRSEGGRGRGGRGGRRGGRRGAGGRSGRSRRSGGHRR